MGTAQGDDQDIKCNLKDISLESIFRQTRPSNQFLWDHRHLRRL